MYAVIRKYTFDPKSGQEINTKVKEGFVPLLKQAPGFIAYYWLDTGAGTGASMSVFKDKAGAEESVRLAADFVKVNLANLLSKPDITEGEVTANG